MERSSRVLSGDKVESGTQSSDVRVLLEVDDFQETETDMLLPFDEIEDAAGRDELSVSRFIGNMLTDHRHATLLRHAKSRSESNRTRRLGVPQQHASRGLRRYHENAFTDAWDIEEHVYYPKGYRHFGADTLPLDLQRMRWQKIVGVPPAYARAYRDGQYHKMCGHHRVPQKQVTAQPVETTEGNAAVFVPKAMHTKHRAGHSHFQLRNLMGVRDQLTYIYANDGHVYRGRGFDSHQESLLDFSCTKKNSILTEPMQITTLALSTDRDREWCMVGGMKGEFALKNTYDDRERTKRPPVVGYASKKAGGIVNHIVLDWYAGHVRGKGIHAVLACNDKRIRTYDLQAGVFLHGKGKPQGTNGTDTGHEHEWPVNCTATSPDGRLRVVVGDSPDVLISSVETGRPEVLLQGHLDYGFACAWSPDGRYVATASQDRLVHIYDPRTWQMLTQWETKLCVRSMRFSPVGGGTKCLALAEQADRVIVVSASDFRKCQTHEFYGEIIGFDFEPDGSRFVVANGDETFGGFMEYERRAWSDRPSSSTTASGEQSHGRGVEEWVRDEDRHTDPRCVDPDRRSPARNWKTWQ